VAFCPGGNLVASGSADRTVKLWDVHSGVERTGFRLEAPNSLVASVAFSPDGESLAAGLMNGTTWVWNVATGHMRHRVSSGYWGWVNAVAFSPQGNLLVTGSQNGTVSVWDPETGQMRLRLSAHAGMIESLTFFPDGRTMVTASDDGTVKLWDVATWQERSVLRSHVGPVLSVAVSTDSQTMATAGNDGTICVWRAPHDRHALAVRRTELDPDRSDSAVALNKLGDLHVSAGRLDEAATAYGKSLSILDGLAPAVPEWSAETQAAYRTELIRALLQLARVCSHTHFNDEAESLFRRAIEIDPDNHFTLNLWAWLLVTRDETTAQDARRAVELALRAVERAADSWESWNTLGVAHYRAGDWTASVVALTKSTELARDGNAYNFIFLAMAHWRLGAKDQARKSYDQAITWLEKNNSTDEELQGFRHEAARVLGIAEATNETEE
jgi:hypothetical protein